MNQVAKKLHPWYTYWLRVREKDYQDMDLVSCKGLSKTKTAEIGYGISASFAGYGYNN